MINTYIQHEANRIMSFSSKYFLQLTLKLCKEGDDFKLSGNLFHILPPMYFIVFWPTEVLYLSMYKLCDCRVRLSIFHNWKQSTYEYEVIKIWGNKPFCCL